MKLRLLHHHYACSPADVSLTGGGVVTSAGKKDWRFVLARPPVRETGS